MIPKRSFVVALVSVVTVVGASACSAGLTPPEFDAERDLPLRDTSASVPPPMGS